jgi:hypothetical protein
VFHPGVWIKNFATASLAREVGGLALNVIIDNDTIKQSQIVAPAGRPEAPLLTFVRFDRWDREIPFEERQVIDEDVFAGFGQRVIEQMVGYRFEPLVGRYWAGVCAAGAATDNLGERLAAGRRDLEREWGCDAVESPLSRLCETAAFRLFAGELILNAAKFADIHNAVLHEYRRANRVRSRHHPVPALERDGERVESPFWLWSAQEPDRQRVFVRPRPGAVELCAGARVVGTLAAAGSDPVGAAAESITRELVGWKLRPRALMTTVFLRVGIADLFIHGIGGAKYDEMTDELIRRYYRFDPPAFVILSATARLPAPRAPFDAASYETVRRVQRDLAWNPDRYLPAALRDQEPIADWIERKFALMHQTDGPPAQRRARFAEFRQINERLRAYLGTMPADQEREWRRLSEEREASRILDSREFAYCLFPADALRCLFDRV